MDKEDKEKKEKKLIEGVEIFILVAIVIALGVAWNFSSFFDSVVNYFSNQSSGVAAATNSVLSFLSDLSLILSAILFVGMIYAIGELMEIRHKEKKMFEAHIEEAYETAEQAGDQALTIRWRTILELVESTNQNDWRQAIIDADTVLDQILVKAGFIGDSLGERLTNANKGDFKTLDQAWEAHKARNNVAHGGSDFDLTQYEAKRIINLYKQVFEEFYFI